MLFDLTYFLYVLPAVLLGLFAQLLVKSYFNKYSKVRSYKGICAHEAARIILDRNGLTNVRVERIAGKLTDHFDPRDNVIRLSDSVYGSQSIASIGIAAHEAGHAIQHGLGYAPMKLRAAIIPVCSIGSSIAPLMILLGLFLNFFDLFVIGIVLFSSVALFQLVTLPVEFNASRRALKTIDEYRILDRTELPGVRKVLSAAALTYVAALLTSIMQILYYISLANRRR